MDGGLFQAKGHAGLRVLLAQFQQPLPEGLGGGVDGLPTGVGRCGCQ